MALRTPKAARNVAIDPPADAYTLFLSNVQCVALSDADDTPSFHAEEITGDNAP